MIYEIQSASAFSICKKAIKFASNHNKTDLFEEQVKRWSDLEKLGTIKKYKLEEIKIVAYLPIDSEERHEKKSTMYTEEEPSKKTKTTF